MSLLPNFKSIFALFVLTIASHANSSDSKEVVIPTGIGWPPYAYFDKEGVLTGTDIELMRKALNKIGYSLKHVSGIPIKRLVKHNEFLEINANFATTYSTERAKNYHFSIPYRTEVTAIYYIDKKYDGLKTPEEFLKKAKAVSMNQSAFYGEDFRKLLKQFHYKVYHNETAKRRFMQLLAGRVDIVIADVANTKEILSNGDFDKLRRSDFNVIEQDVSFAFLKSKFNQSFLNDFDKAIAELIDR